ncbi:MAG: hypothetical protein GY874_18680 [Desulfobacteraceae bacterium]|nr:hypothetical protein [Desulfobacteraceae bacterium]
MVIIAKLNFSTKKLDVIKEVLISLSPKPDFLEIRGPYFRSECEKGIQSMTIYEFPEDKAVDAYKFVMTHRIKPYFNIDGFNFSCNMWLETIEGFQIIDVV